jgi:hypothetical protein
MPPVELLGKGQDHGLRSASALLTGASSTLVANRSAEVVPVKTHGLYQLTRRDVLDVTRRDVLDDNSRVSVGEGDCIPSREFVRAHVNHVTVHPPSTMTSAPVTYELAREARNKHAVTTSSGSPNRPSGI